MGSETDFEMAYKSLDHFTTEPHIYGFDAHSNYDDSEYWQSAKNHRITYELERYYSQVKKLLINNRDFLDAVIEELVSKQTLTFKDIADIRGRLMAHLAIETSETETGVQNMVSN